MGTGSGHDVKQCSKLTHTHRTLTYLKPGSGIKLKHVRTFAKSVVAEEALQHKQKANPSCHVMNMSSYTPEGKTVLCTGSATHKSVMVWYRQLS